MGGLDTTSPMMNQFLTLLLTQLQHQDPMNPMEAREFTTQLAQMSLLEQAVMTNQALQTLNGFQLSAHNARSLDLIGKEVRARGNTIVHDGEGSSELHFSLAAAAATTEVHIYDEAGQLVRSITLGPRGEGDQLCEWEGKDDSGQPVPEGHYTFEVIAEDEKGEQVDAQLYLDGEVEAVQFKNGGIYLMVAGIPVSMEDIVEVRG